MHVVVGIRRGCCCVGGEVATVLMEGDGGVYRGEARSVPYSSSILTAVQALTANMRPSERQTRPIPRWSAKKLSSGVRIVRVSPLAAGVVSSKNILGYISKGTAVRPRILCLG